MSLAAPRGDSAEWVTVRHFSRRFRLALAGLCLGPLPAVADGKAGDCGGDAYTFAEVVSGAAGCAPEGPDHRSAGYPLRRSRRRPEHKDRIPKRLCRPARRRRGAPAKRRAGAVGSPAPPLSEGGRQGGAARDRRPYGHRERKPIPGKSVIRARFVRDSFSASRRWNDPGPGVLIEGSSASWFQAVPVDARVDQAASHGNRTPPLHDLPPSPPCAAARPRRHRGAGPDQYRQDPSRHRAHARRTRAA